MKKFLLSFMVIFLFLGVMQPGEASADEGYVLIEGGSSKETATGISLDTEYAGTLSGDETLYFKFTTPAEKGFFDFYKKNINIKTHSWSSDYQVRFNITDSLDDIKFSAGRGYGADSVDNIVLGQSVTYYLTIHNNSPGEEDGNFKFSIKYIKDSVGDTMEDASTIPLRSKIVGTLDGDVDIDYYKFSTGSWDKFTLSAQNVNIKTHSWSSDYQFYVKIFSGIGELQEVIHMDYGKTADSKVTLLPGTTYYIEIADPSSAHGTYTFSISPEGMDLIDDGSGGDGDAANIPTPVPTPVLTPEPLPALSPTPVLTPKPLPTLSPTPVFGNTDNNNSLNDISNAKVTYNSSFKYTGKEIEPGLFVTYNGSSLVKGTDYTVSYSNNINAGTASFKITGKGIYTGTSIWTFKITQADISDTTIAYNKSVVYTGAETDAGITLSYNGKKLIKAVDYIEEYTNNINAGTASVTIKGTGNFTGKVSIDYIIKASTAPSVPSVDNTVSGIKVCWISPFSWKTENPLIKIDYPGGIGKNNVKSVKYSSSDRKILTVSKSGKIKGRREGKVVVTVTVEYGNGVIQEFKINFILGYKKAAAYWIG